MLSVVPHTEWYDTRQATKRVSNEIFIEVVSVNSVYKSPEGTENLAAFPFFFVSFSSCWISEQGRQQFSARFLVQSSSYCQLRRWVWAARSLQVNVHI